MAAEQQRDITGAQRGLLKRELNNNEGVPRYTISSVTEVKLIFFHEAKRSSDRDQKEHWDHELAA